MFKPCPNCGFLVALIAGREASQRCPRCGSALLGEGESPETEAAAPQPAARAQGDDMAQRAREATASSDASSSSIATASALDAPTSAPTNASAPSRADELLDPDAPTGVADRIDTAADNIDTAPEPAADATPAMHDGPSFARRRAYVRSGGPRWPWVAGVAVLALLLALQLLLAQRVELARDAAWRPLVMRTCALLRCTVPAWHEPQAFAMLARGVRPSGTRRGVLHVSATVRNDARWPQAPPVVVLSLSDVDGRVVGARAVTPADYGHRGGTAIAPGDSVDIAFDVREPVARVESFDFQLQ